MKPISLRWRLVMASVAVQVVLLSILVFNSHRIMHGELHLQLQRHLSQITPLLDSALAAPLAARDLATLQEILAASQSPDGIAYLVLEGRDGRTLASAGWDPDEPLPVPRADVDAHHDAPHRRLDISVPVTLAGQHHGTLYLGISTRGIDDAESSLVRQSVIIAGIEIALSVVLLTLIGLWMTRHLATLAEAARRMAAGELAQAVPIATRDEIGELATAFNDMTRSVERHVAEVEAAEQDLRRYKDYLEELVAERTSTLEVARADLTRAERLSTIGRMTATVSHELRNPLGTLSTSAAVLRGSLGKMSPRTERTLDRIDRSVDRCTAIIDDLLDFVRVRSLRREAVELDPWLERVVGDFSFPSGIGHRFEPGAGGAIRADPGRLEQCVTNLLRNACQSLLEHGGGGSLTVSTARRGERVEVVVSDTGPGIPEELRERIFEPLFSTRSFGAGLGLALVHQVMEQHGGGVEVADGDGGGARFVLWLPCGSD